MAAHARQRQAALMQKRDGCGMDRQQLVGICQRIGVALQPQQSLDAKLGQFQIARLQHQCLIERSERLVRAPCPRQHHGKVFQQRSIVWPLRHQVLQQRQGLGHMALLRKQHTQRMQKMGIARLGDQQLTIQLRGLIQPATLVCGHRLIEKRLKVHGIS